MDISSSTAAAAAIPVLQARQQVAVNSLKSTIQSESAVATALITSQQPAPGQGASGQSASGGGNGLGQLVNITA